MKRLLFMLSVISVLSFTNPLSGVKATAKIGANYDGLFPIAVELSKSFKNDKKDYYTKLGLGIEGATYIPTRKDEYISKNYNGYVGPLVTAEIGKEFGDFDAYLGVKAGLPVVFVYMEKETPKKTYSALSAKIMTAESVYIGVKYKGMVAEISSGYPDAVNFGLGYEF